MSAPVRSQASQAVVTIEPPAPSMVERAKTKELAPFVTQQARALIEPLLKPGDTFERVLSEIWLAIKKDPKLEECTADSLLTSTARILSWGLVIGEGAFLCPFNVKVKDPTAPKGERWESRAQPIRGYQGLIQLIVNAGGARSITAHCVYENEIDQGRFDYFEGSSPRVDHRPILIKSQRGKVVGAYARAIIDRVSPPLIKFMDLEEIDAIRQKSSKSWKTKWIDGPSGRRVEVPLPLEEIEWYIMKTPILQVGKFLSKGPKMAAVAELLELEEREEIDGEIDDDLDPSKQIAAPSATPSPVPAMRPEAAQSAADATSAGPGSAPAPEKGAVEWARAYAFPFQKNKPTFGRPMGEFSTEHLVSVGEWIVEKQKENGEAWHNDTLHAVHLLLTDREKDQTKLDLGEPKSALDDDEDDLPF